MHRLVLLSLLLLAAAQASASSVVGLPPPPARVHTAFTDFGAQVLDDAGNPVAGVDVAFTLSGPGGTQTLFNITGMTSSGKHVTTDASGIARISGAIFAAEPGTHVFHAASSYGSADIQLVATDGARPGRVEIYSGDGQSTNGGGTLARPFAVRVFDADGAFMPRAVVTFLQYVNTTATAGGTFQAGTRTATGDNPIVADTQGLATSQSSFVASILPGQAIVTAQVWRGYETNDNATANFTVNVTPPPSSVPATFQDMWWSGSAENGWGLALMEHGTHVFLVVFAYDNAGKPTWYVMPDPQWEFGVGVVLNGDLYLPTGSPYSAYQAANLQVGDSVGTLNIFFLGPDQATATFQLQGDPSPGFIRQLIKHITRMEYAPAPALADHGISDMWWGGMSQNGWGMSVLEQSGAVFSVWYTYGADSKPLWFVMPGGAWASASEYDGAVYTTTNPTWHSQNYDPAQFVITQVGTYKLRVLDPSSSMSFDYVIGGKAGSLPLQREPF